MPPVRLLVFGFFVAHFLRFLTDTAVTCEDVRVSAPDVVSAWSNMCIELKHTTDSFYSSFRTVVNSAQWDTRI